MKKFIASLLIICSFLVTTNTQNEREGAAAGMGEWSFCTANVTESCISKVIVTKADNSTILIQDATALTNANIYLRVNCTSVDGNCNGVTTTQQIAALTAATSTSMTCVPVPVDFNMRILKVEALALGHRDWSVEVFANTGTFEPAISNGNGIEATSITADSDGTWQYSIRLRPVVVTTAQLPSDLGSPIPGQMDEYTKRVNEFLLTAKATYAELKAEAMVLPPRYLYWEDQGRCAQVPMNGAWATSNSGSTEFGVKTRATTTDLPYQLSLKASGPHFIQEDMLQINPSSARAMLTGPFTGASIVNPADIRMYFPGTYLKALGYASVSDIQANAVFVAASDGQTPTPTITTSGGGFVVDLGVKHYSAPDPTISFAAKTTTSMKVKKSIKLTDAIFTPTVGTQSWKVSGGCKISKTKLIARPTKGKCTLTLTVRNASKTVLQKKSISISVK